VIVAAHNEGELLWKTIGSIVECDHKLDYEIVVADDASSDRSVEEALKRYPQIRAVGHAERKGVSPTKHLGAVAARGDVLVFLDAHCKPEADALRTMVEAVDLVKGAAIVTPRVAALNVETWTMDAGRVGSGYSLGLERFDTRWVPLQRLTKATHGGVEFYESPALMGCALALRKQCYSDLGGFDADMFYFGSEDVDFGLKCWLLGHPILHDPRATISHRFQRGFNNYGVPVEHMLANQIRMARKHFSPSVWDDWIERFQRRIPSTIWAKAWTAFETNEKSAEAERVSLQSRRKRDEFWYAKRFELAWPLLEPLSGQTSYNATAGAI
jgi:glycosyltransferase involved in cell wall biosynthesis